MARWGVQERVKKTPFFHNMFVRGCGRNLKAPCKRTV